jgi:hypothetical protein
MVMELMLSTFSQYQLDHRWVPERIFHYTTSGSAERQEGVTETFFYGDKKPEPHSIDLKYEWIFSTPSELIQFVKDFTTTVTNTQSFIYGDWIINIDKEYVSWSFGNSMNHLIMHLHLVPGNNDSWIPWIPPVPDPF